MSALSCPSLAPSCNCPRPASLFFLPSWCWSEPWTSFFWDLGPYCVSPGSFGRLPPVEMVAGLPLGSTPRTQGQGRASPDPRPGGLLVPFPRTCCSSRLRPRLLPGLGLHLPEGHLPMLPTVFQLRCSGPLPGRLAPLLLYAAASVLPFWFLSMLAPWGCPSFPLPRTFPGLAVFPSPRYLRHLL